MEKIESEFYETIRKRMIYITQGLAECAMGLNKSWDTGYDTSSQKRKMDSLKINGGIRDPTLLPRSVICTV